MKLHEHANKLQTNVENETQNFGIGDASVVIEILRNRLYEHKIQTLSQEYICNARDAMREVGKGNQFEVTVPTHLSPVFKVRDFGPGITPDRMSSVFILYGASTKRGTNNQTGGFGIGAKSAWSYTDSFTIATFIDGVKRSYVAHTGVNNNGRLDLVSTEKTKEKNGTEIQVAVKSGDVNEFRNAILRAIYFWEEKPTLRGITDAPTLVHGQKIGNTVEVINSALLPQYTGETHDNSPLAIIDGVPYPVGDKLLNKCKTLEKLSDFVRQKLILHLNNGIVEVSASRESIADSDKTKEALEKIAAKAALEIKTHIHNAFGAIKTPRQYIDTYRLLNAGFAIEEGFAKYKDYRITNDSLMSDTIKKVKVTEVHCLGRYGRGRIGKVTKNEWKEENRRILLDCFDHTFFLNKKESKISQNKRIREFLLAKNHDRMLILETLEGAPSTALDKIVSDLGLKDFQTITYPVLPKEERVKVAREKTQFCLHTLGGDRYTYTTLADNGQKWLYVPITETSGWGYELEEVKSLNQYLRETLQTRVCGVAERALKMVQGDANFAPLKDWLDNFKPSKKELNYAKALKSVNRDCIETLKCLPINGIEDQQLVDIVKEYKQFEKTNIDSLPEILLKKVNQEKEVKDFLTQDDEAGKLLKREYSLVAELGSYNRGRLANELLFYINAKFKERK